MCSRTVNRSLSLSSYCKTRYLMSLLRKHHHHHHLATQRYSQPSHFRSYSRRDCFKNVNQNGQQIRCFLQLRGFSQGRMYLRFYSSSNRDMFKPQPPIGIVEESQRSFDWKSLGGSFSQSFSQLSAHINQYFKKKDAVPSAQEACLDLPPEHPVTSQAHGRSRRKVREKNTSEDKVVTQVHTQEVQQETQDENQSNPETPRLQLFHISSFANRFGESYTHVANHINSVFCKSFSLQENVSSTKGGHRGRKRRIMSNSGSVSSGEVKKSQVKSVSTARPAVESNDPAARPWDDTYRHFARHINKYFGAKVTDEIHHSTGQLPVKDHAAKSAAQTTSPTSGATPNMTQQDAISREKGGLFHSSHTADFAENYLHMAAHINQYFKGQSASDGDTDTAQSTSERLRPVSILDCLRNPTRAIPDLVGFYINPLTKTSEHKDAVTSSGAKVNKKLHLSGRPVEKNARGLIDSLSRASSAGALLASVEALNEHLICYPSCKALMWQEKTAGTLVKMRRTYRDDHLLQSALRETLALIGYVDPVKGRGIRVLSIDGGGTRGIVPLQVLKLLEIETGKKIHQLFDYICGVSTGAILAFMLGLAHFSLEECGDMYRRFGSEVFRQNPLVGTVQMGWSHSYYKTETWETILQEKLGNRVLIKTARDQNSPKVSAVSAVVNWGTSPKAFVFRNYNHKPGSLSRYAGGSGFQMWQAVRASSAAPGYFQEFPLQSDIHQDGGILLNNPCALAVHESRLLWPNQPFQCVLSLGTGRYDNAKKGPATSTSLRAKISNLICSATDTEGVHTLLDDLLPPDVYFRLNPMLSTLVTLDESRPGALEQLHKDTKTYLERNHPKLCRLCLVLGAERSAVHRSKDWMSERVWEMKQRWI